MNKLYAVDTKQEKKRLRCRHDAEDRRAGPPLYRHAQGRPPPPGGKERITLLLLMYVLVFVLLVFELAMVGLLIAPLSASTRRGLVRTIEGSAVPQLKTPGQYFTLGLASAWVYCLIEMVSAQGKLDSATSGTELRYESALYRSQRNALLCGAATLLLLVVWRLFSLLKEVNQLTASKEALTKQAEGAAAAYKSISEECDALKKKGGGAAPTPAAPAKSSSGGTGPSSSSSKKGGDGDEEDELQRAQATIDALRERNTKLLGERDQAQKDAEALKRQAKGLSDEYARMLAQKESLENKLADFELVLGDEVKKSK